MFTYDIIGHCFYQVMKTIGYKLTALSPTRGSTAGLASSLVVATASYVGIPVSLARFATETMILCIILHVLVYFYRFLLPNALSAQLLV